MRIYVKEHPDATQREIADEFHCSNQAFSKALKRLNLTRKKTRRYKERDEEEIKAYRETLEDVTPKNAFISTNPDLTPIMTGNTAALRGEKKFSGRFPA